MAYAVSNGRNVYNLGVRHASNKGTLGIDLALVTLLSVMGGLMLGGVVTFGLSMEAGKIGHRLAWGFLGTGIALTGIDIIAKIAFRNYPIPPSHVVLQDRVEESDANEIVRLQAKMNKADGELKAAQQVVDDPGAAAEAASARLSAAKNSAELAAAELAAAERAAAKLAEAKPVATGASVRLAGADPAAAKRAAQRDAKRAAAERLADARSNAKAAAAELLAATATVVDPQRAAEEHLAAKKAAAYRAAAELEAAKSADAKPAAADLAAGERGQRFSQLRAAVLSKQDPVKWARVDENCNHIFGGLFLGQNGALIESTKGPLVDGVEPGYNNPRGFATVITVGPLPYAEGLGESNFARNFKAQGVTWHNVGKEVEDDADYWDDLVCNCSQPTAPWVQRQIIIDKEMDLPDIVEKKEHEKAHLRRQKATQMNMLDPEKWFEPMFSAIDEAILNDKKVLVHCQAGSSRSATLLAAYLINRLGVTADQAIRFLQNQRRCVEPKFVEQLREYENILLARRARKNAA